MQWFKHDANAHRDTKLKKLMMRYGMEGYGLYFYCLELITDSLNVNNMTFKLEDDAEIIAHDTGIHNQEVEQMMRYMVELGLFEDTNGVVTCYKIARRLDQSMSGNFKMRAVLKSLHNDGVMPESIESHDSVMQEENRIDEKRKEEIKEVPLTESQKDASDVSLYLENKVRSNNPKARINITTWSKDIDLAIRIDKRTKSELIDCINWIYTDAGSFWQANILSGKKLREKYDTIFIQMTRPSNSNKQKDRSAFTKTNYAEEVSANGFGENNI